MTAAVSRYVRVVLAELELELGPRARHLLEVLGNCAGADGSSWWSVESLAARMAVTPATVRRARAELVAAGLVMVDIGGGRQSNTYRLPITSALGVVHTPRAGASAQGADPARGCATPRALVRETPRADARGSIQEGSIEERGDVIDTTPDWWRQRFGHLATGTGS